MSKSSSFFLPTGTGTSTHSNGKSSVKIEQMGNFLPLYLQMISTERKEKTREQNTMFNLIFLHPFSIAFVGQSSPKKSCKRKLFREGTGIIYTSQV